MEQEKKTDVVHKKWVIAALVGLAIILAMHFFGKKKPMTLPPPQVVVQKPVLQEMAEYVTQTGTTVAYNSVNLVARVEGYLEAIEFRDGSFVKKGQPLFVIQPKPYLEQLKAAKATVAAQEAISAYAKSEYARQQRMYRENATSLNNVEKWLARVHENDAEIDKAIANAEIAAINYGYTHVASPFDGRIGRHLVDIGNLVGNGEATTIATVEQISPLYVYFNLNEIDLLKLRDSARKQGLKAEDIHQVPVGVSMQNATRSYPAKLDFVNTGLNASTGTMEFRAVLENTDYHFVPGLFVQVRIPVTPLAKQLTVPDSALLFDQIGPYLLTVNAQNRVAVNRVVTGSVSGGMRAVLKGLSAQDRVIVDGLQYATEGALVDVVDAQKAASEGAP